MVLEKSAFTPIAVLLLPMVLLARAHWKPLAVLLLPVVLFWSASNTVGRVVVAGGVGERAPRDR